MSVNEPSAIRLLIFLTEDDRIGGRGAAESLIEQAKIQRVAGATLWRGIEGFGRSGHLRAARLPDLARGLPLILEIVDAPPAINEFCAQLRQVLPGVLYTTEPVSIRSA